jgi:hypothetical protein
MGKSDRTCYYCGKKATTKEHVPPKQMFKGFDCDSITVPSCIEHNCTKSGEDQAIVTVFLIPIKNYIEAKIQIENNLSLNILKATNVAKHSFERTKNRVLKKPFLDEMPDEIKHLPDVGFLKAPIKLYDWIKKLTAGIVYDGIGHHDPSIDWDKIDCWSTEYYDSKLATNQKAKLDLLLKYDEFRKWFDSKNWIKGWSAYPRQYPADIYSFYFCFDFEDITIKHCFYKNYNCYASFKTSFANKNILLNKLKA